jgi:hypothetical protein
MESHKRTLLKVAVAAVAVVGGSFLGAAIGVPMLSLAAQSGADATPSAVTGTVDNVADTVDDVTGGATAPRTGTVDQATNPAPGQPNSQVAPAAQAGDDQRPAGPHAVGDCTEKSLSSDDEAKVKAAVEKEVPGATIDRIETECDGNGVYEAHLRKSDGTPATAYLNESFEVTSVQDGGPGGPGHGRGAGGPGAPAGQLSGDSSSDANA